MTKWILAAAAALALLTSARQQSLAQKSHLRAVLLEQTGQTVQVGLLYQDVAAAADASEAGEVLKLACAAADTLEAAFRKAETALPQQADYKLCDYVLLCGQPSASLLTEYEQQVQRGSSGRLAAYLYASETTLEEFAAQADQSEFLSDWLDALQARRANCPRLYRAAAGAVLLPCFAAAEGEPPAWSEGAWLLCPEGCTQRLDENAAQLFYLMQHGRGEYTFWLDGETVALTVRAVDWQSDPDGTVRLTVQARCATGQDTARLETQLAVLARELLSVCGQDAGALLDLNGVRALAGASAVGSVTAVFELYTGLL